VKMERDPITKAIYGGIKKGIQVAVENNCYASAVILILSGIDSMAFLNMPASQTDVTRTDFIEWAERYIKFPCSEQLTGPDLYGARCAMLHSYGVVSKMSREGMCRMVGYMSESVPEIRYNPAVNKNLVLVSVPAFAEAFYKGIDHFLVNLFSNKEKAIVAEDRLKWLVQEIPVNKNRV
jgi:hypothetical protein